ncbi:MAG: sulfite exporter TauE/SafE family protein [Cellvibrionales bacterium TMED148]|nr:hypothetical protein [Porticoccaceae bacterium]RPG91330.1 MAG: sulfite exporter TauE/SafE family protein [Cellvibrionales bacterium TMED148]
MTTLLSFSAAPHYSWLLLAAIALMAILYSSVGHGGASGYLAAMLVWGLSPEEMRPAALLMNITVTLWLVARLKRFYSLKYQIFWPLIIASTPMAFVGGSLDIDAITYKYLVAAALLAAAIRLLIAAEDKETVVQPSLNGVLLVGGALGFLAGISGIGGGVFLSPLLIICRWSSVRESTLIAAGFILMNSIAGLAGYILSEHSFPEGTNWLVLAAFVGSVLGGEMAVKRVSTKGLKKVLSIVLLIAAAKIAYQQVI